MHEKNTFTISGTTWTLEKHLCVYKNNKFVFMKLDINIIIFQNKK